jgi:hypothetical protein
MQRKRFGRRDLKLIEILSQNFPEVSVRSRCRLLVGKPEGKRPLGKSKRRWVNNIGWILEKLYGVVWTG